MRKLLIIATLFSVVGCNPTTLKVLDTLNESANTIAKTALPKLERLCDKEALNCKAKGITEKAKCAPVVKCEEKLDIAYDTLILVHLKIAAAAPLVALGDDVNADILLQEAVKLFTALVPVLKASGLLDRATKLVKSGK